jgi:hypothetical protein
MKKTFLLAALLIAGCDNPVTDVKIEALGGEAPNTPIGPHHRPGQPCVLCHSEYFGAQPELVIGGTVFRDRQTLQPVEGVRVVLYDSVGDIYEMLTNCNGNFMREKSDRDPQFPLYAEIYCPVYGADGTVLTDDSGNPQTKVKSMASWISRDGSCAGCHTLAGREADSVGWIVCNELEDTNPIPDQRADCEGKPPQTKSSGSGAGNGMGSGMGSGMGQGGGG